MALTASVKEWFERCKTCIYVKLEADEVICLKRGECNYIIRPGRKRKPLPKLPREDYPTEKKCPRCQQVKPWTEFGVRTDVKFMLKGYCRECYRDINREYRRKKDGEQTNKT